MFEKRGIRNKTSKKADTSAFDDLTRANVCVLLHQDFMFRCHEDVWRRQLEFLLQLLELVF